MADLSDICSLVWPLLRTTSGKLPPSPEGGAWIAGWNPVGLSVVVTALLPGISFEEACQRIEDVKRTLAGRPTPHGVPSYKAIQLLGYVRGQVSSTTEAASSYGADAGSGLQRSPAGSPAGIGSDGQASHAIRSMRRSDIWLELQDGPVLGEVWCCGYRVQPCQLHVIRCDPLKVYSTRPTHCSAVSLYGPGGVQQLKAGKWPVCVPGVESNLEGVLLPDVMMRESAPRVALATAANHGTPATGGATANGQSHASNGDCRGEALTSSATRRRGAAMNTRHTRYPSRISSVSHHVDSSSLDAEDVGSSSDGGLDPDDGVRSRSFLGLRDFGADVESMSQFPGYEDGGPEGKMAAPGVPPRLDFPTSADAAELGILVAMCTAGYNVEAALRGRPPVLTAHEEMGLPACAPPPLAYTPSRWASSISGGDDGDHEDANVYVHIVCEALIQILVVVLRVVTPLQRVLWLMEVLEHRARELVNLLSLLDGRTQSCGLHPALPHHTRCTIEGRMICCANYLLRMLSDVAGGALVMLLLRTQGPRMYTMAMHLSRYFIYETHMAYMDWFDGWPAGLKVNEDLNQALCFLSKVVLRVWDLFMRQLLFVGYRLNHSAGAVLSGGTTNSSNFSLFGGENDDRFGSTEYFWIVPCYDVLVPLSFLGVSCSCALVADITGLVTLHLRMLYHIMSLPYRFATALLSSLSNQFRGKKYNPLRKRTDVHEFSVDQMLMATFLFTIVVFLFPTVAVYYFYFALIRTSIWGVQETLVAVAHLMLYVPVPSLLLMASLRKRLANRVSGGINLTEPMVTMVRTHPPPPNSSAAQTIPYDHPSTTVEMTVESRLLPLGIFLSDFLYVISVVAKPFAPMKVIAHIASGTSTRATSPRADLIPHLIVNPVDPPCTLGIPAGVPAAVLTSATAAVIRAGATSIASSR